MTTDIERELRELFRDKAGEAPVATPAAPQRVLRRGRRRQVGTIVGSAAIAVALIVGSVAGLQSILRGGANRYQTGPPGYETFRRTATIEAFTVASPSSWFLVNEWPLSMQMAVGSGSASGECTAAAPGVGQPSPVCTSSESSPQVEALPHGLPMLQLSNVDLGLSTAACGQDLPTDAAVLFVGLDYERAIFGAKDPSIGSWPVPLGDAAFPEAPGPCGAGSHLYSSFSVNGEPFFAWVGFGDGVTDADRSTVLAAYESMTVDDAWEPVQPKETTPAYVIAGGVIPTGDYWRLELRPSQTNVRLSLVGTEPEVSRADFSVPETPLDWCCRDHGFTDVTFGALSKAASGVEFRPFDGAPRVPGVVVPVPPSMPWDFDLFFIEGTAGLTGEVVALGLDEMAASTSPPPVAEPRGEAVELSGSLLGQDWSARFTGAFADESACIHVTVDVSYEPLCLKQPEASLASGRPSMHLWVTKGLALFAGSVPPDIVEIRFTSDDGSRPASQFRCEMGPTGWTDPDKRVCAIALPSEGSGTLEFLDADGGVLFDEGDAWSQATAAVPRPVDPVHGGTYWAVYAWLGAAGSQESDQVVGWLFDGFGVQAIQGDLACDQGAAEALGTDAAWRVAVYFRTEQEAETFAKEAGLLDHENGPIVAHVTTYCLD